MEEKSKGNDAFIYQIHTPLTRKTNTEITKSQLESYILRTNKFAVVKTKQIHNSIWIICETGIARHCPNLKYKCRFL